MMRPEETRQWERIPVAIPVFIRGVNDRGKEFLEFTSLLNISNGGALLAVRNRLPPKAPVTIEIPSAPRPNSAAVPKCERVFKGRLVRLAYLNGSAVWGLQFQTPLAPVEKLHSSRAENRKGSSITSTAAKAVKRT